MKLSKETIKILKNYANINPSLVIKEGNKISTISESKMIFSSSEIEETFPRKCVIYDMNMFLSSLSLMDDPEIEFDQKSVKIKDGKEEIAITYGEESLVISPPDKVISLPSVGVSFKLHSEQFKKILKALSILSLPEVVIKNNGEEIYIFVEDVKNKSSNKFSLMVGNDYQGEDFSAVLLGENLKLLQLDYKVNVCFDRGGIVEFKALKTNYLIPCQIKGTVLPKIKG